MKITADLHIHSKYSRATSKNSEPDGLSEWAKIKGLDLIGTGDFTHPLWLKELKEKLSEKEKGIYEYNGINFLLTTEISNIFKVGEKTKKMHTVLFAPSFEVAEQINDVLSKYGNLKEDGRPTLSISSAELLERIKEIEKDIFILLAHIWTPWFSVFGSKSGFDSLEEAFGETKKYIDGLETGLSSDPAMNWIVSELNDYPLLSNSDAHSPPKLGREFNLFEMEKLSYSSLIKTIKTGKGFLKTYEFYPQEGKYFWDGHRKCNVQLSPYDAIKLKNICPVCRKPLTLGVLHRIVELSDKKEGFKPKNAVDFEYHIPLPLLIASIKGKGENTQGVQKIYFDMIKYFGNEFKAYNAPEEELGFVVDKEIVNGIKKVREGKLKWSPGYDGVFGHPLLKNEEVPSGIKQRTLGEY
ncbi:DNA helicase UvrD [Candidatus Micrarchaeota archaeon]|nr:DNA helicase UvrD [Candidatus Micrarchaeota archaeon]